jgi:hypothetical protein
MKKREKGNLVSTKQKERKKKQRRGEELYRGRLLQLSATKRLRAKRISWCTCDQQIKHACTKRNERSGESNMLVHKETDFYAQDDFKKFSRYIPERPYITSILVQRTFQRKAAGGMSSHRTSYPRQNIEPKIRTKPRGLSDPFPPNSSKFLEHIKSSEIVIWCNNVQDS